MHVTISFLSLYYNASHYCCKQTHGGSHVLYHSKSQTYGVDDEADVLKYSDTMNNFCHKFDITFSNYSCDMFNNVH